MSSLSSSLLDRTRRPRGLKLPLGVWLAGVVVGWLLLAGLGSQPPAASSPEAAPGERFIGPGVKVWEIVRPEGPQVVQIIEVDRREPRIHLGVTLAGGRVLGLETVSVQAAKATTESRYPIAAINGDFFAIARGPYQGMPIGAFLISTEEGDEIVRTPYPRTSLVIGPEGGLDLRIVKWRGTVKRPDGVSRRLDGVNEYRKANTLILFTPRFGDLTHTNPGGIEVYLTPDALPLRPGVAIKARVRAVQTGAGNAPIAPNGLVLSGAGSGSAFLRGLKPGDEMRLEVQFDPPLAPGTHIIGGGPRLVSNGQVDLRNERGILTKSFAERRHPRTAVGLRDDKVFLVAVDGRQPGHSVGMSLRELAEQMVALGCTEAMNLDGGGSTTLWVRGQVLNRPSDGRERRVANTLMVFSTAPKGALARLRGLPRRVAVLAGSNLRWTLHGEDQYYNPVKLSPADVVWASSDPAVKVDEQGRITFRGKIEPPADTPFATVEVTARIGRVTAAVALEIYPVPAKLTITPAAASLLPGESVRLRVRAWGVDDRELMVSPEALTWSCPARLGRLGPGGLFQAVDGAAAGEVVASFGGVTAKALLRVGGESRVVADFEAGPAWTLAVIPEGLAGSVSFSMVRARSGSRSLAIRYDFSSATGTRAVYAKSALSIGPARRIRAWVYGDGSGSWLRARARGPDGKGYYLTLARAVDWQGEWREVSAKLPATAVGSLTLESIYVVEIDDSRRHQGVLYIDDLRADFSPPPAIPSLPAE